MLKGLQNGIEIKAKTHQELMPKLVSEKIMDTISNRVCLKCENMQFIVRVIFFTDCCGREEKVSQKHQR